METIEIPFRGNRDYVTGVDLLEFAINRLDEIKKAEITKIKASFYEIVQQNNVELTLSKEPLSSDDYIAVISALVDGSLHFVGFKAAANANSRLKMPCNEEKQLELVSLEASRATIFTNEEFKGELLALLVAAIKASSKATFPECVGKWLFCGATLHSLPRSWRRAEVTTRSTKESNFFIWSVVVDNQNLGNIVFFIT